MAKTVADRSAAQQQVADLAALPRTLMGGTRAMRAAGTTYLPQEEAESVDAYRNRLARSTLFNAFGKTVSDMTGKVFSKPVVLKDDVPPRLKEFAEDIDLTGRHINIFARDVFFDAMQAGVNYIFVDMPPAPEKGSGRNGEITLADEIAHRPYLVHITAENLIGWKSTVIDGAETLTQVRIREVVTEPDGPWHEVEVEQIRVLEPGRWEIWRKAAEGPKTGEWVRVREGMTSLRKITLVPFYTNRTGFMTGSPPLQNLADLNVTHWQSSSDQRNILHVARVPILFWAGREEGDELVVGANALMCSTNPDAKLTYVEHTGAAIDSGDKDLQNLEFQMQTMGLQLLVNKPGQTATGEVRDDSKENSPLAMMARSLGDALEAAFGFMAEFLGMGEDAGGEIEVNTDFGIQAGALSDVPNILSAYNSGAIDQATAINELKRRGFLSDSVDAEDVIEATAAEADAEADALAAAPGRGMNLG